ncbi:SsgA family sporulation/cell division regulator [Streptomyces sp. NPDC055013]
MTILQSAPTSYPEDAAMDEIDFDALLAASSLGAPQVTALRDTLSALERQRLHTAVERAQQTAATTRSRREHEPESALASAIDFGTTASTITVHSPHDSTRDTASESGADSVADSVLELAEAARLASASITICVVGEFRAGKSLLLNTLLGRGSGKSDSGVQQVVFVDTPGATAEPAISHPPVQAASARQRDTDPAHMRSMLRGKLRQARGASALTQTQVAETLEWSLSKLIRIETGLVSVSRKDLRRLLALYEVTDPREVEDLFQLARGAAPRPWWTARWRNNEMGQLRRYCQYVTVEDVPEPHARLAPYQDWDWHLHVARTRTRELFAQPYAWRYTPVLGGPAARACLDPSSSVPQHPAAADGYRGRHAGQLVIMLGPPLTGRNGTGGPYLRDEAIPGLVTPQVVEDALGLARTMHCAHGEPAAIHVVLFHPMADCAWHPTAGAAWTRAACHLQIRRSSARAGSDLAVPKSLRVFAQMREDPTLAFRLRPLPVPPASEVWVLPWQPASSCAVGALHTRCIFRGYATPRPGEPPFLSTGSEHFPEFTVPWLWDAPPSTMHRANRPMPVDAARAGLAWYWLYPPEVIPPGVLGWAPGSIGLPVGALRQLPSPAMQPSPQDWDVPTARQDLQAVVLMGLYAGEEHMDHSLHVQLIYRADDPYAVHALFYDRSSTVVWRLARELLADGLDQRVGAGDVAVWSPQPHTHAPYQVTFLRLRSPRGSALLTVPRQELQAFLLQTRLLVPIGGEYRHCESALRDLEEEMNRASQPPESA